MRRMKVLPLLLVVVLFLPTGCGERVTGISDELPRELDAREKQLVQTNNRYGLRLFRTVNEKAAGENVILSPLSTSLALGMTMNGAAGETRTAMETTLGFAGMSEEEINKSYRSLIDLLLSLDDRVAMELAQAIFYRNTMQFEPDFLDVNRRYFDAEVQGLDFTDPNTLSFINNWVSEKTHGKIDKILDSIDPMDVMYLLNALYFKGTWVYAFKKENTRDDVFHLPGGDTCAVKMMRQTVEIPYLQNEEIQAVELPYGRGVFRMTLILPNDANGLEALIAGLTAEKWQNWMQSFHTDSVTVELPRFKLRDDRLLNQPLKDMGMAVAFDPMRADFTRMYRGGGLYISFVRHKTFIEVNEEGTEAAAVTIVGIRETSVGGGGPKYFRVDRPFLFAIREKNSGTILFIAKVVDPQGEE